MAATVLTVRKSLRPDEFLDAFDKSALTTAVNASDGMLVNWDFNDDKMILLVENANASAAQTVTIRHGNGIQGVNDLSLSLPAGKMTAVCINSGRFKNISGDLKGQVKITGTSADIKVAAFRLA